MTTPLYTLKLGSRRDIVLARQRARQIAGLLGFPPAEQTCIAAAVFEIARTAYEATGSSTLCFQADDGVFRVFPSRRPAGGCLRLEKSLPADAPALAREDLEWAVRELARFSRLNLFEEIRQQNQELLHAVHKLQTHRADPARTEAA
jgi:hypothetical protein